MPTINEVWEQALLINANLATLHNDQVDLKNCCALTNQRLAALDAGSHETNDWQAIASSPMPPPAMPAKPHMRNI